MRTQILTLVFVLTASMAVNAEDTQKYKRDTEALIEESKHEEALERILWYHNHALEHEPAQYGVRLSFALSTWKELGDVYPPALTAMQKNRDDKTDLIVQKKGNFELFHDVESLNQKLGDDKKTVELFRKLDKDQKDMAKECWDIAKEAIIKA